MALNIPFLDDGLLLDEFYLDYNFSPSSGIVDVQFKYEPEVFEKELTLKGLPNSPAGKFVQHPSLVVSHRSIGTQFMGLDLLGGVRSPSEEFFRRV